MTGCSKLYNKSCSVCDKRTMSYRATVGFYLINYHDCGTKSSMSKNLCV